MTRPMTALVLATALALAWSPGCGDSDPGTAPVISNLVYSPTSGQVSQTINITGQLRFVDPDADVTHFAAEFRGPISATVGPQPTQGTVGLREGDLAFQMAFTTPAAGSYEIDIWLIDAAGNRSNVLTGPLEVAE